LDLGILNTELLLNNNYITISFDYTLNKFNKCQQ
jgi:hypothetical protein